MSGGAVVLLSAGLDSTVNLFCAHHRDQVKLAITFDYGQLAAPREIERAHELCGMLNVPHKVIKAPWLKEFSKSSLTLGRGEEIPVGDGVQIDDIEVSYKTAKSVWVPNRNGVLLNIAAAYAEALEADWVIPGFNSEEAATFPDNTEDFLRATDEAFRFSTQGRVKTKCYTIRMNKTEIVKLGRELEVPFSLIWPCYKAEEKPCGECESCQRFHRALSANGMNL